MPVLNTDPKKVAKAILPSGFTDYTFGSPLANFNWRKSHGHAGGRMIERALNKAKLLGFVPGPYGCFNTPDGSVMGHKGKWHHPDGWELEHCSSYGCVAYDNSFSIWLTRVI